MDERKIEKCQCCGNYYVKIEANKICTFCKSPPSRTRAKELKTISIKEYNKRNLLSTINRYIQRNSNNNRIILTYLHKKLEENKDIPEHKKIIDVLIKKHEGF